MRHLVVFAVVLGLAGCPRTKPPATGGDDVAPVQVDDTTRQLRERYEATYADAQVEPVDEVYPDAVEQLAGCETRTAVHAGLVQIFVLCDPGVLIDSRLYDPPDLDATAESIAAMAEGMATTITHDELAGLPLATIRAEPAEDGAEEVSTATLLLSNEAARGMPQVLSCAFLSGPDPAGQEAWCRRTLPALLVEPGEQMGWDDRFIQIQLPPRDESETAPESD